MSETNDTAETRRNPLPLVVAVAVVPCKVTVAPTTGRSWPAAAALASSTRPVKAVTPPGAGAGTVKVTVSESVSRPSLTTKVRT